MAYNDFEILYEALKKEGSNTVTCTKKDCYFRSRRSRPELHQKDFRMDVPVERSGNRPPYPREDQHPIAPAGDCCAMTHTQSGKEKRQ